MDMTDIGPALLLTAVGLALWLAVDATLAGISIQTIGVILAIIGVVWLLIELVQSRGVRRRATGVRDEPVARGREACSALAGEARPQADLVEAGARGEPGGAGGGEAEAGVEAVRGRVGREHPQR